MNLKKIINILSFCLILSFFFIFTITTNNKIEAQTTASISNTCKWEISSCGWFCDSREVCVTTGNGNTCNCGAVTRACCSKGGGAAQ
ncbi:MAG: hypothetical protein NW226_17045 [Microscillaceae bacterium]|nr:hypothetical protein [Microscillaceae bacterium]